MLSLLTILNTVFQKYLDSLKRDLGQVGFNAVLIVALLSWIGIFIILWLIMTGDFQMPSDPLFYVYWFGVTFITASAFTLGLLGLLNTTFFAASGFGHIGFVVTTVYAAVLLGERYTALQIIAVAIAATGSLLFFKRGLTKSFFQENKGLFLIFFALLISPLGGICYKAATLHTYSYHQFLTGRLTTDLTFYTLFFGLVYAIWYRRSPIPHITSFFSSRTGAYYAIGATATNLFSSWLIFKIPLSRFTVLSTVSIPTAYLIGRIKYKEPLNWRYIFGAALIAIGVIGFLLK